MNEGFGEARKIEAGGTIGLSSLIGPGTVRDNAAARGIGGALEAVVSIENQTRVML